MGIKSDYTPSRSLASPGGIARRTPGDLPHKRPRTKLYVWWPGIGGDLEEKVSSCGDCQRNQKSPPTAPLQPWDWPERPWSRVHADYAGPFLGRMFLVLVDAHSKWIEVLPVTTANSQTTIEKMKAVFATFGLPDLLVTDNGTPFTSAEFQEFLHRNGIRHARSSPYHPASNGLAERAVQSFKEGLKKTAYSPASLETRLARFLFQYRITPHSTTGRPPSELLMGRVIQSHLDLVKPRVGRTVRRSQELHDSHSRERTFVVGVEVLAREFVNNKRLWTPGVVTETLGPLTYLVRLDDGRIIRRHIAIARRGTFPACC